MKHIIPLALLALIAVFSTQTTANTNPALAEIKHQQVLQTIKTIPTELIDVIRMIETQSRNDELRAIAYKITYNWDNVQVQAFLSSITPSDPVDYCELKQAFYDLSQYSHDFGQDILATSAEFAGNTIQLNELCAMHI